MNFGQAEQQLVDRLNAYFASVGKSDLFEASLLPDNNADYKSFYQNFTKTRVAVSFQDSQPQPATGLGTINQDEIVSFRFSYEARGLRSGGVYDIQELCKKALIGYRLQDSSGKLSHSKYGLLEFEQNGWQPYDEFSCKTTNVQSFTDDNDSDMFGDTPFATTPSVTVLDEDAPDVMGNDFNSQQFQ